METISLELTSNLRRETLHGRRYIVADASMIVPGVLNGSQGALYYPVDEVKKNPGIWNGVPVTVGHPYDLTGNNVSARDPKIEKQFRIGTVYNDRFENGKRKAEVWLDEELTKNKSPEIYKSASAGVPIELSTGLFTDNEQVENGKAPDGRAYDYVARNYRPDHLAILPNQTGACSLKDGCGLNVNKLLDNCGGEGGTPGPCASGESQSKSNGDGRITLGGKEAHAQRMKEQSEGKYHTSWTGGKIKQDRLYGSHSVLHSSAYGWYVFDHSKDATVAKGLQSKEHAIKKAQELSGQKKSAAQLSKKSTTNTEVTSVTNEKRTLLSQLASLLGFKVNPVANTKKVCDNDDDDGGDMTDNCGGEGGTPGPCKTNAPGSGPHPGNGKSKSEIASALSTETRQKYGQKNLDTRGHTQAAEAHENAVGIHQEAAKEQSKLGNYQKATTHAIAAKNHAFSAKKHRAWEKSGKTGSIASGRPIGNNSSNGDDMDRNKLVSWLTTNCDCHKGKEKVLANQDNYSDEELLKLKTNAETAMKNATLVANAKLASNAEVPVEEEEEEDEEEDMPFKGKKKAPMVNSLAQFEASMPPAAKAIWNSAKEVEQSERLRLTSIITANISDVARKQVLTNKLMDREKTTLDDLRDLASAIPQRQVRNQQGVIPNYFGSQPGAQTQTNNISSDDVLDLPTINWADLAKSGDVRTRV